jgi:hypothetical protein
MTSRRAGFFDCHAVEAGDVLLDVLPDPHRQQFGGGVLETFDLIEQIVIEAMNDRIDGALQIGKVDEPSGNGVDFSADRDLTSEGVTVDAATLVALRYIGKPMGGFESKILDELDGHSRKFIVGINCGTPFAPRAMHYGE